MAELTPGTTFADHVIRGVLGLSEGDLLSAPLWVDTGVDQLLVPLRTMEAVRRASEPVSLQCFRRKDLPELLNRVPAFFRVLCEELASRLLALRGGAHVLGQIVRAQDVALLRPDAAQLDDLPACLFDVVDAAFVVDCTGRSGIVARARNTRRYHDGPSTIALVAEWRGPFLELHDQSHTAIESYQDGWMWSVPIAAR